MTLTRRQFLMGASTVAFASQAGWSNVLAARLTGSEYQALVCVFMLGGNDGNNTVVPMDAAGYAAYAKARGAAASGGLALAQSSLAPLNGTNFALHPALAQLTSVWNANHLAIQFNVGTLTQPTTKAALLSNAALQPLGLYSHIDQQNQWQTTVSNQASMVGWAGRISDLQASPKVPMVISTAGNSIFSNGMTGRGLAVPAVGQFNVVGFGSSPTTNPAYPLYTSLLADTYGNSQVQATASSQQAALQACATLNPVLGATSSVASLFAGQNNSFAQQMLTVAKIIEQRGVTGASRQIFFVALDGFDTHSNQLPRQDNLLGQVGPALAAFYQATVQLGVASQVTTFTASDFARTLQPSANSGSDHAWGNHQFIMGGAVKGGLYGTFPQLLLGGPDDVTAQGRWLPSTSVVQMSATLATWFGVAPTDLPTVFPSLGAFSNTNMHYFG